MTDTNYIKQEPVAWKDLTYGNLHHQDFGNSIPLYAAQQPVEQEPVGRWNWNEGKFEWLTKFDYHKHHMTPLYAAPVRTKDLTDDEIEAVWIKTINSGTITVSRSFARAVIAAYKEKQNGR